jgi:tRNA U34 5-methylaminomethyl-2-thiouridine-forming methyltransferase MnmC
MKKEYVITKDGSHSIYLPEMDEHYHSTNGSITESEHIFIQMGLVEATKLNTEVDILEIGMGTGLNVLTTFIANHKLGLNINYLGLEAFPLNWEMVKDLNFSTLLKREGISNLFKLVHSSPWNEPVHLTDNFILTKSDSKIQLIEFTMQFDLVYFDAFAPEKQEEMWTEEIFKKIYNSLRPRGILVTYCVKGVIRRRLQSIGFKIEKLPGPIGGKREMLRARKVC